MLGQRTETARELLRSEKIYVDSLRVIVEVRLLARFGDCAPIVGGITHWGGLGRCS